MGLYSKALAISQKPASKGLLKKSIELLEKSSQKKIVKDAVKQDNQDKIQLPVTIIDDISQQINLCKINKLPLAIVFLSCTNLIDEIVRYNEHVDMSVLRGNMFSFMEQFFSDETKLFNLGSDRYLFTLYNPNSVDPELVLYQLSEIMRYYVPDITEDVRINFNKKIRLYPNDGDNVDILLNNFI
jgi:hypothetical protein